MQSTPRGLETSSPRFNKSPRTPTGGGKGAPWIRFGINLSHEGREENVIQLMMATLRHDRKFFTRRGEQLLDEERLGMAVETGGFAVLNMYRLSNRMCQRIRCPTVGFFEFGSLGNEQIESMAFRAAEFLEMFAEEKRASIEASATYHRKAARLEEEKTMLYQVQREIKTGEGDIAGLREGGSVDSTKQLNEQAMSLLTEMNHKGDVIRANDKKLVLQEKNNMRMRTSAAMLKQEVVELQGKLAQNPEQQVREIERNRMEADALDDEIRSLSSASRGLASGVSFVENISSELDSLSSMLKDRICRSEVDSLRADVESERVNLEEVEKRITAADEAIGHEEAELHLICSELDTEQRSLGNFRGKMTSEAKEAARLRLEGELAQRMKLRMKELEDEETRLNCQRSQLEREQPIHYENLLAALANLQRRFKENLVEDVGRNIVPTTKTDFSAVIEGKANRRPSIVAVQTAMTLLNEGPLRSDEEGRGDLLQEHLAVFGPEFRRDFLI